jgi:hypothetical protein
LVFVWSAVFYETESKYSKKLKKVIRDRTWFMWMPMWACGSIPYLISIGVEDRDTVLLLWFLGPVIENLVSVSYGMRIKWEMG